DGDSLIRPADNPSEARGVLSTSQPTVVLLDARGLEDLAAVVGDLQSPDGARIVVIFATAEQSDDVARSVRGSAAFAVLAIPVVPPQAAAVLEGACEEARARHALLQGPTSTPPPPVVDARPETSPVELAPETCAPSPSSRLQVQASSSAMTRKSTALIGVGVVGLLVIAVSVAWWLQEPVPATGQAAPSRAVSVAPAALVEPELEPQAVQAGSIDELLDSARTAMRERRYTDPENRSAYSYYRSVLAQDPGNGEAREGLERIATVLQERVQASIEEQRWEEAGRTLAQLRAIRPAAPEVAGFDATLREAHARSQAEIERRQVGERADQLADLVSLRIRQGKLLDPANDSARHYLAQLRRLPGDVPRAGTATTELQQAYLGRLRDALAKSQRTEAERWKAAARGLGVSATELSAVQRDVAARAALSESKQEGARIAQLVQQRIADGRLLEPASDSAVFHLNALRALDPAAAIVASNERALSGRLVEHARFALAEQRLDDARTHAAAARQLGVDSDVVAALERDIANAGATPGPAGARPAPRLVRTRYVAPQYPAAALKQGLTGSVRLRLAVNAEGHVSEAMVVQASPPGIFDAAAVNAARKWRFKAIGPKGSEVHATATVDMLFKPEDAQQ
ncbi:MAG TPA: energy transducer TonB, partial [Steroidobacteraceae bacterium]|nr:energy transducer TonB [Steroidobacteraceae bacterium]